MFNFVQVTINILHVTKTTTTHPNLEIKRKRNTHSHVFVTTIHATINIMNEFVLQATVKIESKVYFLYISFIFLHVVLNSMN